MKLFGFEFFNKEPQNISFSPPIEDDGASIVNASNHAGFYSYVYDNNTTYNYTESELITKYRELALQSEIKQAIEEIINEMIATDEVDIIKLNTDKLEQFSNKFKKLLQNEFNVIVELYDFNKDAYEIAKRFYTDGQLKYHIIIDENDPSKGIVELRYIDPRKLKKIKEAKPVRLTNEITAQVIDNEYYIYNEVGFDKKAAGVPASQMIQNINGLKISKDAIIYITSGLMNENNTIVLSYLYEAIRPFNQLRSLEDASIIYKIVRAPERRIFYIDVGGLPKAKAEQYIREIQTKYRNKLVYNSDTGQIKDDRKHPTMLEDIWLPRQNGSGTTVDTLQGAQSTPSDMDQVEYFRNKLYKALNVPISRLDQNATFSFGRATEISRDELKFSKFIARLRLRFAEVFLQALKTQLILKNIITLEDWDQIRNGIYVEFANDSHIAESKRLDLIAGRIEILQQADQYRDIYFSKRYIYKNILCIDDDEWEEMESEIEQDQKDGSFETSPAIQQQIQFQQDQQSFQNDQQAFQTNQQMQQAQIKQIAAQPKTTQKNK